MVLNFVKISTFFVDRSLLKLFKMLRMMIVMLMCEYIIICW